MSEKMLRPDAITEVAIRCFVGGWKMSVATSLRDATTGHITLDQSPRSENGWEATAQLKPIIVEKLYNTDAVWYITGGVADGPFDALMELARQCAHELWRFEVAITKDKTS